MIEVSFDVKRIKHYEENTGFVVAEVVFRHYGSDFIPTNEHVIVGQFPSIYEGDEFSGKGKWTKHRIFGYRFEVTQATRVVPQTKKGMEEFLKRCVKGIGGKTASLIVDTFGEDTLRLIEESADNLLKVPGIGKKRAEKIHKKIRGHRRFEEVAMFVFAHGGNYQLAIQVYEAFGDVAIQKIRENPYSIVKLKDVSFYLSDRIAVQLRYPYNAIERIEQAIIHMLRTYSNSRGDLFVKEEEIYDTLYDFTLRYGAYDSTTMNSPFERHVIAQALSNLEVSKSIVIETNEAGERCTYLSYFNYVENRIVEYLKRLIEEPKPLLATSIEIDDFIKHYEAKNGFTLATRQKEAIHMALSNGMSILTGGPGTGKTATVNAILECLRFIKPHAVMHLSAPTGKACKRMTELTKIEAKTIHRLIGLNPFDEEEQLNEVEGDLLVIDESSMVDAHVFYKLLSSITDDTRILFVGDHEQLPSVGAGLILRDLIESKKIPTTRLNEIFRQAQNSQIVMNSHKVIRGVKTTDKDSYTFDQSKKDFYYINREDNLNAKQAIIESMKRLIDKHGYTLEDIQVLSPMWKGDLGIWSLNQAIQETFNPRALSKREYRINETFLLREGDKVIQTVNRIDKGVVNGDVGTVISIEEYSDEVFIEVEFDEGLVVTYDLTMLEDLDHAFCLSIHKSQGSEYPIIIMPIHMVHAHMLNRNLVYTAWTRAKKMVVNVGTLSALDYAVKSIDNTIRNSLIKEKVIQHIAGVRKVA